ncbi:bifunctional metallophosphatase/5'-nucleotidase [Rossellomorea vietnamensis]|uniref:Bifunctional metallophosphatase/5'-nucleotidase n=1 Tax=Rossellomorea vietnamensis TaxID=218284 RepID=A0A5D4NNR2_9BACI|nr:bifunctional metallophosphatase/5'-nucleotidase [Rossellomorea vietnamensis]
MMSQITLTILETSDIHGNIFPVNYGTNEIQPLGLGKAAAIIKKYGSKNDHVLTIDNGDIIQGTPLTYHYVKYRGSEPNPMIEVLNHLQYDAAVIGNHEFNYGLPIMQGAAEQSSFPWLSANILDKSTGRPYFGTPYILKEFGSGLKAAVLGVTTHYIPNWENPEHIPNLDFADAFETAKHWVTHIREKENPEVLIVSYHGGFENDPHSGKPTESHTSENQGYRMCTEIDGIDVLLTGHQHRQLAGTINNVLILQPGFNGEYVGKADIIFEKSEGRWHIVEKKSELLPAGSEEEDEEVLQLVNKYEISTQEWLDQPIGFIEGDMTIKDPLQARMVEHPLVEFINNVQMDALGVQISNTALFNNSARGLPSTVTMRDIVSNYVYPNTLTAIEISGKDMKDALERSASYFLVGANGEVIVNPAFSVPKPQHYNYDMWEGIEYTINISNEIGKRIEGLQYNGKPVEMNEKYEVVMNNYRAGGGGEYPMFKNRPITKSSQIDMAEMLANYFLKHKTVKAAVNHNWKVVK